MTAARSAGALLLVGLSGCSFAPPYHVPASAQPAADYQEIDGWRTAQPADSTPRGSWWEMFGDSELNALEVRVAEANQNLKAALARLEEARATTRIAQAALLPSVTAGPSVTRTRTSPNSPSFNRNVGPYGNDFTLQADLSYEIDLWGRIRNNVAAARAEQAGTAADLASLALALHAETASDYFTLRSQDAQIELLEQTVSDYEQALTLTQNLYDGGAGLLSDVYQAQAQLASARTQVADLRLMRAQTEHALALLSG